MRWKPLLLLAAVAVWALAPQGGLAAGPSVQSLKARLRAVDREIAQESRQLAALKASAAEAVALLNAVDRQIAAEQGLATLYAAEAANTAARARAAAQALARARRRYRRTLGDLDTVLRWADAHDQEGMVAALVAADSLDAFFLRLHELGVLTAFEDAKLREAYRQREAVARDLAALTSLEQHELAQYAQSRLVLAALARSEALRARDVALVTAHEAAVAALAQDLRQRAAGLYAQILALERAFASGHLSQSALVAAVQRLAAQYGVDPNLVLAVIVQESGGNPAARSPAGAMGLMQLMPGTAAMLGVQNPWDPQQNLAGGVRYLALLLQKYHGDVRLALAAYNAGPGAVARYGGVPPYPETQHYVQDVLSMWKSGQ